MPGMNGPALVERLERRGVRPRVLFTSGHTSEDIFATHAIGAERGFIGKPWTPRDLSRAVREMLDRSAN